MYTYSNYKGDEKDKSNDLIVPHVVERASGWRWERIVLTELSHWNEASLVRYVVDYLVGGVTLAKANAMGIW